MLSKKVLNCPTLVNRRMIPNQDNWAAQGVEQMLEKSKDLFTREIATIDLKAKFDLAPMRRNDQAGDSVETVVMLQAGTDGWGLPAWRPCALERRDQAEATFVHKNQARAELTPLFLSAASGNATNGQSPRRRAVRRDAGAFGNSTACSATDARPRWDDSAPRIGSGSDERCGPTSSSRPHSRELVHLGASISPDASIAPRINDTDVLEILVFVGAWSIWLRLATVAPRGASRRAFGQLRSALCLAATKPSRVCVVLPVVGQFLSVSCRL